jgi:glycosyltransferase involved in cell wall biosynthesis
VRILVTIHHELVRDSGAPGTTLELADAYRRAGHQVELLSFDDLPAGLPIQAKMLSFPALVASRLVRRRGAPTVVDASSGDAWLWAMVRRTTRLPVLVTRSHGLEHVAHEENVRDARTGRTRLRRRYWLYHGGSRLWELRQSFVRADLAVFLNRRDRDYAVAQLGVRADRTLISANGLPPFLLGRPAPANHDDDPLAVTVIGRYTPEKGAEYARDALIPFLSRRTGSTARFLGADCSPERVRGEFPRAVRERVHVVERYRRSELPDLVAGSNVLVFPTIAEGFGKSLLEGMACGLAPIASAASGPRDIISDQETGLVVPLRDSSAILTALERLDNDRDLLSSIRRAAHAQAQTYDWDRIANARLEIYEQLVGERQRATRSD